MQIVIGPLVDKTLDKQKQFVCECFKREINK